MAHKVVRVGYLPEGERQSLLDGAAVLAYPSLYEGFGFPPLEAMAAGVPVVATAAGAVPEVVGDAAELVAPGDHVAMAAALARVLDDAGLRARLVEAGRCPCLVVHLGVGGRVDDRSLRRGSARPAVRLTPVSVSLAAEQLRRRVPGGIGTYARGSLKGVDELRGR